jgi:hypothetical protein
MSDRRLFADVLARASPTFKRTLVELRNDQVDPKEHEQAGEAKQDIAEREDQSAGETKRMPLASKDREDHRRHYGDDGDETQGSPVICIRRRSSSFASCASWPFLGLGGASNRGSSGYVVVGAAAASTKTSWLSVTLAWVILWRREMK